MTEEKNVRFTVKRIVVALDTSPHAGAALADAARLAARLQAEVEGLFVEDIDLFNLSDLPFGREIRSLSGQVRAFDRPTLESDLKAEVARARSRFEALLRGRNLHGVFRVVRGRVDAELISAAAGADLLILGMSSRGVGRAHGLGSTALAALAKAPRSVLLSRSITPAGEKTVVAYDGTPGADQALEAGAGIAGDAEGSLIVALLAEGAEENDSLERRAREILAGADGRVVFRRDVRSALEPLCRITREGGIGLLVVAGDSPILAEEAGQRLVEGASCPVLVIR